MRNNSSHAGKLQPKIMKKVMMILGIFFFIVSIGVSGYILENSRRRIISVQGEQLGRVASQISFWQTTSINIAKKIAIDGQIQEGIMAREEASADYYVLKRRLQGTLATYKNLENSIQEIMIYTEDGRTFSDMEKRGSFIPEENGWYLDFLEKGKRSGYTDVHMSAPNQEGRSQKVISYIFPCYAVKDYTRKLGDIIISFRYEQLEEILEMDMTILSGCFLQNEEGDIIFEEGEKIENYEKILLIENEMQEGWVLGAEISGKYISRQLLEAGLFLAAGFFALAFSLWLMLRRAIGNIVKPIEVLTGMTKEVGSGNFDITADIHTGDEIETLAEAFRYMSENVRDLIRKTAENEKLISRMHIDNLMLQINPHFIYNTLNSIVYMACEKDDMEIVEFTQAFIALLQNVLQIRESVYISMEEALENVEHYLVLQKYRYMNKFQAEIICGEDLKKCAALSIMMQPIVENAIFHGIVPKETEGVIKIEVKREEENVLVLVEDNGVGMTEGMLENIRHCKKNNSNGMRHIGIANVNDRIQKIFGEAYGIEIFSREGIGTRVVIKIPYRLYEN